MALPRPAVRRLFIAVLILLPVQYVLVGIIGLYRSEPWPALVMPGFQRVYAPDAIREPTVRFEATFADGYRLALQPTDLLEALPRSHHGAVLTAHFRPASLSGSPATERARTAAAWLRHRLHSHYPDARPVRLDVIWEEILYLPNDGSPIVAHDALDTLTISLR